MLQWIALAVNGFWIAGLAIWLAGFSYHYWLAQTEGRPLRQQLASEGFRRLSWLGLLLVALGLAGSSRAAWEVAIWLLVALYACVRLLYLPRRSKQTQFVPAPNNQKDKTANADDEIPVQVGPRAPDARAARPDSAT